MSWAYILPAEVSEPGDVAGEERRFPGESEFPGNVNRMPRAFPPPWSAHWGTEFANKRLPGAEGGARRIA